MKNRLPLILTLVTGAGLFFWLRRKKSAGTNLRYEPIDIAIDSQRSAASLFSRIYYNLKLRLINNESANVNIRAINLQAFLKVADRQPRKIGDIVNNAGFQVPAKGQREIKLDTSISTGGVIQIIKDLLIEGINFEINVNGFVDTDLGRLNINFTKDFGSGRIAAPVILTGDKFTLMYKKNLQPTGRKARDIYKYMLNAINTGAKINDFVVVNETGQEIPGTLFFDQAQSLPYDLSFSRN